MNRKVLSSKYYLIIVIVVSLVFYTSVVSASKTNSEATEIDKQTNILVSSHPPESSVNFIQIVNNHQFFLKKNTSIKIKAYIEPNKTYKKIISAKKELEVPEQAIFCKSYPCLKKWNYDFTDGPIDITDLPHMQFSWTQSAFAPIPEITFEAELSKKTTKDKPLRIKGGFGEKNLSLKKIKTINMKKVQYVEKSITYLAKRELGLKTDNKWYHSVCNDELILQSRVDLPFKKVQIIKVSSDSNLAPKIVQFSIDRNGNGCRDDYILFNQVKYTREVNNGKSILSIDVRPAISLLGIDINKASLMEVIVFLPSTFQTYLKNKPLHEVLFFFEDRPEDEIFITPTVQINNNHYKMDFDLRNMSEKQFVLNSKIVNLKVTAFLGGPQIFKWNSIFFYNRSEKDLTSLIDMPSMAIKKWGENKLAFSQLNKIASFRPLWVCRFQKPNDKTLGNVKGIYKNKIPTFSIDNGSKQFNSVVKKWHSKKEKIKGKLFYCLSGKVKKSYVNGWIQLEQEGKRYKKPFCLLEGSDWFNLDMENLYAIKDLSITGSIYIEKWPFQITLFDVQSIQINKEFDYRNCEWWQNEALLPLALREKINYIDQDDGKLLLYTDRKAGSKWHFSMPNAEFILPLELIVPGPLPKTCKMFLKVKNKKTQIPYGPYVLPLSEIEFNGEDFELSIEYSGSEPIIWIDIPIVRVMGLKQTPINDLNKLMVVIDDYKKHFNIKHLPDQSGEWIDMGVVHLDKGKHFVKTINNDYFKIKTLVMESGVPVSMHDRQSISYNMKISRKKKYIYGIKITFIILFCVGIYTFRTKIKYMISRLCNFIRGIYPQLNNKIMIAFWIFWTISLYCIGMITRSTQKENYYYTIGAMAFVMALLHFSRQVKNRIFTVYPKVASCIYQSLSAIFFAWSIALLFITAFLVASRLDALAEQVAIIIYYLLFAGIINKIIESKQKPIKETNKEK